ncbi:MAG TPA: hypothetical protein DCQ37_06020 [Desulfobacteraceae bacterium]|nr:hypothetical protein [Desulfobacteraceae bacterium]
MNNHPVYSHDRKGDILYISFSPGEKEKTAVKLTYDILLRFNRAEKRAIGITILNYSDMIKITERRQQNYYIPLDGLDDLEPDWQEDVIETLKRPPANYEVEFAVDNVMGPSVRFEHFDSFLIQEKTQRMAA